MVQLGRVRRLIEHKAQFVLNLKGADRREKLDGLCRQNCNSHFDAVKKNGWSRICGTDACSPFKAGDYAVYTVKDSDKTVQLAVHAESGEMFAGYLTHTNQWYGWEKYAPEQFCPKNLQTESAARSVLSVGVADTHFETSAIASKNIHESEADTFGLKSKIKLDSLKTIESGKGISITKKDEALVVSATETESNSLSGMVFEDSGTTARVIMIDGITSYGMLKNKIFTIKASVSGVSGETTLNVNNMGAKALKFMRQGNSSATSVAWKNWINKDGVYMVVYDGNDFTVLNPLPPEAEVSHSGVVKLCNDTDSTSTTEAATANSVKAAYDKAMGAANYCYIELSSSVPDYRYIEIPNIQEYEELTGRVLTIFSYLGGSYSDCGACELEINDLGGVEILYTIDGEFYSLPVNWCERNKTYQVYFDGNYFILLRNNGLQCVLTDFDCTPSEYVNFNYGIDISVIEIMGQVEISGNISHFNMRFRLDPESYYQAMVVPILIDNNQDINFICAHLNIDYSVYFEICGLYTSGSNSGTIKGQILTDF